MEGTGLGDRRLVVCGGLERRGNQVFWLIWAGASRKSDSRSSITSGGNEMEQTKRRLNI